MYSGVDIVVDPLISVELLNSIVSKSEFVISYIFSISFGNVQLGIDQTLIHFFVFGVSITHLEFKQGFIIIDHLVNNAIDRSSLFKSERFELVYKIEPVTVVIHVTVYFDEFVEQLLVEGHIGFRVEGLDQGF